MEKDCSGNCYIFPQTSIVKYSNKQQISVVQKLLITEIKENDSAT